MAQDADADCIQTAPILTLPAITPTGEEKAAHGWLKMLMLTVIAGCYVGFGFSLCLLVGGNIGL